MNVLIGRFDVKISRVTREDLEEVEGLVLSVSEQDVLPHFNEEGKSEFLSRVLPDIEKTLNRVNFYSVKLVSDGFLLYEMVTI